VTRSALTRTLLTLGRLVALPAALCLALAPAPGCGKGEKSEPKAEKSGNKGEGRGEGKGEGKGDGKGEGKAEGAEGVFGSDDGVEAKGGGAPLVLFIVVDTVRADHLSVCGYDRPTSPYLASLAQREGVSYTCEAHAPGPWTVPSHASYFTGLSVPEHGSDAMGVKFADDLPTLAETMKAKGYQPVMLSANPTLSKLSGLQRGFEFIKVPRTLTDMRGDEVRNELKQLIAGVDPAQPMFLFVNLIDAHDPYPRVPDGVPWVPAQPSLVYDVHEPTMDTPYHRYFRGLMTPDRQREYETQATNGYDYGLFLADQNVHAVIQLLRREGWMKNGFRMVITSDHGEFLGEHHQLRHGCWIWEPVTKVPFFYYDSASKERLDFSSPFTSLNAYYLLRDAKLPDAKLPVTSYSNQRDNDIKVGADMAALWTTPEEKLVWMGKDFLRYDLAADPAELAGQPIPAKHPQRATLEKMAASHQAHLADVRARAIDPALKEQLVKLGYWEEASKGAAVPTPEPTVDPE
jgi:hypothetical protein